MARVINTTPAARHRRKLMQGMASAMERIEAEQCGTPEQLDCLAYICLLLRELEASVASTVNAWERRSYWVKADNFQRQWKWASEARIKLEALLGSEATARPEHIRAALHEGLSSVGRRPRETSHRPWSQARKQWSERQ